MPWPILVSGEVYSRGILDGLYALAERVTNLPRIFPLGTGRHLLLERKGRLGRGFT